VITSQYLEYIEIMKELNLEIAGDFLVMAATLIQIKSRMLLPPDEEAPLEEQEDPRRDLVQRLLEYQRYKDAALDFRTKEDEWLKVFHREPLSDEDEGELYLFDLSLLIFLMHSGRSSTRHLGDCIYYKRDPDGQEQDVNDDGNHRGTRSSQI